MVELGRCARQTASRLHEDAVGRLHHRRAIARGTAVEVGLQAPLRRRLPAAVRRGRVVHLATRQVGQLHAAGTRVNVRVGGRAAALDPVLQLVEVFLLLESVLSNERVDVERADAVVQLAVLQRRQRAVLALRLSKPAWQASLNER